MINMSDKNSINYDYDFSKSEKRAFNAFGFIGDLVDRAEKVAENIMSGEHVLGKSGEGDDFRQYSEFSPQEHEPSKIDWKKSAKSDRLFIREKEKKTEQSFCFWCAGGQSMNYKSSGDVATKFEDSFVIILAIAIMLAKQGERIKYAGNQMIEQRGMNALNEFIDHLSCSLKDNGALPDFDDFEIKQNAKVIMAGDFLMPAEEFEIAIGQIASHTENGTVIQVLDNAELTLPFNGRAVFTDISSSFKQNIENIAEVRKKYSERVNEHNSRIKEICNKNGFDYYLHDTSNQVEKTLMMIG